MLTITRKQNQAVMIGNNIKVIVSRLERGQVRLSIDAPPEIRILREEIYKKNEKEE